MQEKTFILDIKSYVNITYGKQFVFIEFKEGEWSKIIDYKANLKVSKLDPEIISVDE